jgi:hypothetical protein
VGAFLLEVAHEPREVLADLDIDLARALRAQERQNRLAELHTASEVPENAVFWKYRHAVLLLKRPHCT